MKKKCLKISLQNAQNIIINQKILACLTKSQMQSFEPQQGDTGSIAYKNSVFLLSFICSGKLYFV